MESAPAGRNKRRESLGSILGLPIDKLRWSTRKNDHPDNLKDAPDPPCQTESPLDVGPTGHGDQRTQQLTPPPSRQLTLGSQFPNHTPGSNHSGAYLRVPPDDERPGTAQSADTEKQAKVAFRDFDGVHYIDDQSRQLSPPPEDEAPLPASRSSHGEPSPLRQEQVDEGVVYYPAPVPMTLNMPQRLSRLPSPGSRENRRSQVLSTVSDAAKQRASWLPRTPDKDTDIEGTAAPDPSPRPRSSDPRRSIVNLASLPPQLRASVFFQPPPTSHEVTIREQSATATLESILDASTNAPVSAFTDHPFLGHVGTELYGEQAQRAIPDDDDDDAMSISRKRKSLSSLMSLNPTQRSHRPGADGVRSKSTSFLPQIELGSGPNHSLKSRALEESENHEVFEFARQSFIASEAGPGSSGRKDDPSLAPDALANGEAEAEAVESSTEKPSLRRTEYYGQSATLLAELQFRKHQQRQRNMTAATAFPNGMHSTLLELDTVAEVQKLSRQNRRITLAWEDPNRATELPEEDQDEEVPLGMLFPGLKNKMLDEDRPLGLIEKRALEESEPLSRRRERLMGGVHRPRVPPDQPRAVESTYRLNLPGIDGGNEGEDETEEEETLAQRARRLKAGGLARPASSNQLSSSQFMGDLMSHFGVDTSAPDTPEAESTEETLGQRKRRLQAEHTSQLNKDGSRAAQPQRPQLSASRQSSGAQSWYSSHLLRPTAESQPVLPNSNSRTPSPLTGFPVSPGRAWVPERTQSAYTLPPTFRQSTAMSMPLDVGMWQASSYNVAPSSPSLGLGQREMIDRWRLSVLP